eukprot:TRINITY_DN6405_c0_g1_i1.p1 TRINITY_DN6405_c0_g1~~TRINITY_DN6405_c0_g1_i1.p1  ORF type:complete len:139 (-),score=32.86 TRINITY_DN6405_c0_g1_i1:37-453(-)
MSGVVKQRKTGGGSGGASNKEEVVVAKPNYHSIPPMATWRKGLSRSTTWEKSELLNLIHWLRQFIAITMGIICGAAPVTTGVGNMAFFAMNVSGAFAYFSFLGISEDELRFECLTEGLMTAYGLFAIVWIFVYNLMFV